MIYDRVLKRDINKTILLLTTCHGIGCIPLSNAPKERVTPPRQRNHPNAAHIRNNCTLFWKNAHALMRDLRHSYMGTPRVWPCKPLVGLVRAGEGTRIMSPHQTRVPSDLSTANRSHPESNRCCYHLSWNRVHPPIQCAKRACDPAKTAKSP